MARPPRSPSALLLSLAAACEGAPGPSGSAPPEASDFANPEPVIIEGYAGHAMEPFIARDGSLLLFNDLNADTDGGQPNDTDLQLARHLSGGVRFEYVGPIAGASTDADPAKNELEAVPSLDGEGRLYFTSTAAYGPDALAALFQGQLADATVTGIAPIGPLASDGSPAALGDLNMDAEIAPDGELLVFTDAHFSGGAVPDSADLGMAKRQPDGSFAVLASSAALMKNVNSAALEYAPSSSADGRELYFTRWAHTGPDAGKLLVVVSRRTGADAPWEAPVRVAAIDGEATEAPSLSGDGRSLYYHQKIDGQYRIHRVTRP